MCSRAWGDSQSTHRLIVCATAMGGHHGTSASGAIVAIGPSSSHDSILAGVLADAATCTDTHVDDGRSGTHGSLGTGHPDTDAAISRTRAGTDTPRPVGYYDVGRLLWVGGQSGGLTGYTADRAGPHDSIIALENPVRVVGTTSAWTLRCQRVMRGMDMDTLRVVMSLGVTISEARAWYSNTEQQEAAQTAESSPCGSVSTYNIYWGRTWR